MKANCLGFSLFIKKTITIMAQLSADQIKEFREEGSLAWLDPEKDESASGLD